MSRRPPKFRDFIGHKPIVNYLRRQLDGALARGEPFPHTLLLGPSGAGKTRLSKALAEEYGTRLIEARGYHDRAELARGMTGLAPGDIFFVDECHRLRPLEQEMLTEAMDSNSIGVSAGQRPDAKAGDGSRIELQPFTLILATDQPGLLLDALRKRIVVEVPLSHYPDAEMKEIVEAMAGDLDMLVSPQAARILAEVAGGVPRWAQQLLRNLRLFHPDSEGNQLGVEQVRAFLDGAGVDEAGLNLSERRYMDVVAALGSASLDSIALGIGTDAEFVRRQVEPGLVRRHLVRITSSGRRLTPAGQELMRRRGVASGPPSAEEGGRP